MYKSELCNIKKTKEILKNDSPDLMFKVYHKVKKRRGSSVKKPNKDKITLATLLEKINDLNHKVDDGFKQVNTRIDVLEKNVNARLDYIVKANDLKDMPNKH